MSLRQLIALMPRTDQPEDHPMHDAQARPEPAPAGRLLVLEPMSSGLTLLATARELGLATLVFSHDAGDRVVPEAARQDVDLLVAVDTNDPEALAEAAAREHARSPLSGVISGSEFYTDAAARIAHLLGLPGLPLDTAEAVRDKTRMRAILEKAGLRIPRYAPVSDAAELAGAAAAVGYPCVLKPAAGSGSIQVSRVDDDEQLRAAYRAIAEDAQYVFDQPEDGRALLEEYLDGPEYSVEGYVHRGEVTVVSVTRKLLGAEPYFVELGHVVQADLAPAARAAVVAYTADAVTALGINLGLFHAEVRITADGPVLIEVGARLAGDRIAELIHLATGVSMRHIVVAAHAGLDREPADATGQPVARYAGVHFLTEPGLEVFHRADGLEEVERHPRVVELRTYYQPGTPVPPARDLRCRLGHVIFTADSPEEEAELRSWIAATVRST
ncbi:ATP-grasp domain-containing protein [Kitasatospora sp. NPDC101176]|uniref:ATP-grasp domain-containing protein n=1 Tax=Kitasatospora sp. NPDC101176 TaxID=3364099 RepID=UPI0037FDB975